MKGERRYLTDEYRERLCELAETNSEASQRQIEARYIEKCKELRDFLKDGTPDETIRRLSLDTMESEF